jgi:SSS family solute:Na+ symporter
MEKIDYIVLVAYFLMLVVIGFIGYTKVKSSADFYTAGGKLPWWLSGVSHHVSGYSGAVFVAYAGVAYTHGFSLYIWWSLGIALSMILTTTYIAPRWARLRAKRNIQSPTEYLAARYNFTTQQIMAWLGVIIKIFDVGAKWAAIGVLLNAFTGIPFTAGIAIAGTVTLVYITLGGLWADVWNDFASFFIQLIAGSTMFVMVLLKLGDGAKGVFTMWDRLPPAHSQIFNTPYTPLFTGTMMVIFFFSYGGGTWHLATRFMSASSGTEARKAAILSTLLYLLWPLILFFPMFAAPIFIKDLAEPTQSYSLMAMKFLPHGLLGLLLASMFANTLSMTSADANTISAVITRDILPFQIKKIAGFDAKKMLMVARITTLVFIVITIIIAIRSQSFGGVFGLIVVWFSALIGPISIPMILGLLRPFRHCGSGAAITSIITGLVAFAALKILGVSNLGAQLATPLFTSLIFYVTVGFLSAKKDKPEVDKMLLSLNTD